MLECEWDDEKNEVEPSGQQCRTKDNITTLALLCPIWKKDLMPTIIDLPAMDVRYAWPRSMYLALGHFIHFKRQECQRNHMGGCKKALKLLFSDHIEPMQNLGHEERKKQGAAKNRRDDKKIENLPSDPQDTNFMINKEAPAKTNDFTLDEAIQCTNCSHQPAHGVH